MKYSIIASVLSVFCFCCSPAVQAAVAVEPVAQVDIHHNVRNWLSMPIEAQVGGRIVLDNRLAVAATLEGGLPYVNYLAFLPQGDNTVDQLRVARGGAGVSVRYLLSPNQMIGGYYYHDGYDISPNIKTGHWDYRQHVVGVEGVMLPFTVQINAHQTVGLPNVDKYARMSRQEKEQRTINKEDRALLLHWVGYDEWGASIKVGYRYSNRIHPFGGLYSTSLNSSIDFGAAIGLDYVYTPDVSFKFKAMMDTKYNPYVQCGVRYVFGGHHLSTKRLRHYLRQPVDRHVVPVFPGSDINFDYSGKPKNPKIAEGLYRALHWELFDTSPDKYNAPENKRAAEAQRAKLLRYFEPIPQRWYNVHHIENACVVLVDAIEAQRTENDNQDGRSNRFSRAQSRVRGKSNKRNQLTTTEHRIASLFGGPRMPSHKASEQPEQPIGLGVSVPTPPKASQTKQPAKSTVSSGGRKSQQPQTSQSILDQEEETGGFLGRLFGGGNDTASTQAPKTPIRAVPSSESSVTQSNTGPKKKPATGWTRSKSKVPESRRADDSKSVAATHVTSSQEQTPAAENRARAKSKAPQQRGRSVAAPQQKRASASDRSDENVPAKVVDTAQAKRAQSTRRPAERAKSRARTAQSRPPQQRGRSVAPLVRQRVHSLSESDSSSGSENKENQKPANPPQRGRRSSQLPVQTGKKPIVDPKDAAKRAQSRGRPAVQSVQQSASSITSSSNDTSDENAEVISVEKRPSQNMPSGSVKRKPSYADMARKPAPPQQSASIEEWIKQSDDVVGPDDSISQVGFENAPVRYAPQPVRSSKDLTKRRQGISSDKVHKGQRRKRHSDGTSSIAGGSAVTQESHRTRKSRRSETGSRRTQDTGDSTQRTSSGGFSKNLASFFGGQK